MTKSTKQIQQTKIISKIIKIIRDKENKDYELDYYTIINMANKKLKKY